MSPLSKSAFCADPSPPCAPRSWPSPARRRRQRQRPMNRIGMIERVSEVTNVGFRFAAWVIDRHRPPVAVYSRPCPLP